MEKVAVLTIATNGWNLSTKVGQKQACRCIVVIIIVIIIIIIIIIIMKS